MADVLRDDGISYQNYVTELTYILFLKMMKEQGTESTIPDGYRWDDLVTKEGIELKTFYKKLLLDLGNPEIATDKRLNMIYADASTSIDEPKILRKSSRISMHWIGILLSMKDSGICMRACLKRMRMRQNLGQGNISHLVS